MVAAEKQTVFPFEDTHKTAYSHGFESIYALETVDPKTIRKIDSKEKKKKKQKLLPLKQNKVFQFELDYGPEYRGYMKSFLLFQPVESLDFSNHIEKALIEHGIKTIDDLFRLSIDGAISVKGLGQGHIDEIETKLKILSESESPYESTVVHFDSWLKSLVSQVEKKKILQLLKKYQLDHLLTLKSQDRSQLWKVSDNKVALLIEEAKHDLISDYSLQLFHQGMNLVASVFLIPWMRKRKGLATKEELFERLQRVANDSDILIPILNFFSDIFCDSGDVLEFFVPKIDQHLYACDRYTQFLSQVILEKSLSYFYQPQLSYPLNHLVSLVERECASFWLGFPDGFVAKIIRYSSSFRVRKSESGYLRVKLS